MSANWSDVLVQQHAKGAARSAGEPPGASTGLTSARLTTNAPHASTPDTRTGQPQRGSHSQSHGVLYSPSSPRMHTPLAAARKALRTSSNTHKPGRSASHTGEHSGAQQSPEEIARDELQRKLTNSVRAHVGGVSSSGSGAATQRSKSGRAREPQAAPQRGTAAPVDSSARSARHVTRQPRKGKVYCGQNKLDPSLRVNGGTLEVGTRSRCFRAGFGGALHQHIDDEAEFVRKFTAPYAPLIAQKLWYKDGPPPEGEGYQPAILSQARQRGWGAGSAALARKLQKKLNAGSAGTGRTRTRSASTRSASPPQ